MQSASERYIFFNRTDAPQIDKSIRGPWPGEPRRQIALILGVPGFSNSVPSLRIIGADRRRDAAHLERPLPQEHQKCGNPNVLSKLTVSATIHALTFWENGGEVPTNSRTYLEHVL